MFLPIVLVSSFEFLESVLDGLWNWLGIVKMFFKLDENVRNVFRNVVWEGLNLQKYIIVTDDPNAGQQTQEKNQLTIAHKPKMPEWNAASSVLSIDLRFFNFSFLNLRLPLPLAFLVIFLRILVLKSLRSLT